MIIVLPLPHRPRTHRTARAAGTTNGTSSSVITIRPVAVHNPVQPAREQAARLVGGVVVGAEGRVAEVDEEEGDEKGDEQDRGEDQLLCVVGLLVWVGCEGWGG